MGKSQHPNKKRGQNERPHRKKEFEQITSKRRKKKKRGNWNAVGPRMVRQNGKAYMGKRKDKQKNA